MAFYRCYNIGFGGDTLGVENFIASNDTDALERADRIRIDRNWHALEMWESYRKIRCPDIPPAIQ